MQMLLDKNRLITERHNRAWSQSELAQASDLSLRTIQRIEKDGRASLESAKALASVYCLDITDINQQEETTEQTEQSVLVSPQSVTSRVLLTAPAKTFVTTMFILSSIIMLFLVWTNLPNVNWIHQIRDAWFSSDLSSITLKTISSVIALLVTFIFNFALGLLMDAARGKGFYAYVKAKCLSGEYSFKHAINSIKLWLSASRKLLAKPVLISAAVIAISATGIFLTMEDYQKVRVSSYFKMLFDDKAPLS